MLKLIFFNTFFGMALLGHASICFAGTDVSHRLERFIAKTDTVASSGKPTREKAAIIDAAYSASFAADPSAIPDEELDAHFEATQYLMFYTLDKARLPLFEQIVERLNLAGKATPEHHKKLMQAYFALREFNKANAFAERHGRDIPQYRPIVAQVRSGPLVKRTAWIFQGQGGLTRRELNLDKGRHLVMIASPYCHFARAALTAIEDNPTLAPLLASRITVMAMNDFSFDYAHYAAWNQAHPSLPFTLTHDRDEWPEVSHWVSPVFLFFRDGRLESQFSGWPKEGNMDKIVAGFHITFPDDMLTRDRKSVV